VEAEEREKQKDHHGIDGAGGVGKGKAQSFLPPRQHPLSTSPNSSSLHNHEYRVSAAGR
jgi:hypothetical protein